MQNSVHGVRGVDTLCRTPVYNSKNTIQDTTSHNVKTKDGIFKGCHSYINCGICNCGHNCDKLNRRVEDRWRLKQCRHELQPGGCKLGNACDFLHTRSSYDEVSKSEYLKKNYKHRPCRYFNIEGGCRNDKCYFLHEYNEGR